MSVIKTIAAAAVLLGLVIACKSATFSANSSGKFDSPVPAVVPDFDWSASISAGEDGDFDVDAGPQAAGVCAAITFLDADENVIGTASVQADSNGSASGSMPEGTTDWTVDVSTCPDGKDSSPGNGNQLPGKFGERKEQLYKSREFLVMGAPIVPSDGAGEGNLTYSFSVRASSFSEARKLVQPIIEGGIGTPVPVGVKVISFSTVENDIAGGRVVSAMPGTFSNFTFDFNDGAFTADLATNFNTLNYQLGGWDVVEMLIPQEAFDSGVVPGVTYVNGGTATYSTDRFSGDAVIGYTLGYSY